MLNYLSHKKSDHLTQKSESDDSFVFSIYIYIYTIIFHHTKHNL